jgi:hypothetical protein
MMTPSAPPSPTTPQTNPAAATRPDPGTARWWQSPSTTAPRHPAEPHLLPRRHWFESVPAWILIAAAGGADLAAFYVVLENLFNAHAWLIWVAAIGFALAAAGLAHEVGKGLAARIEGLRRSYPAWPIACFLVWFGLGLAAFVVRLGYRDDAQGPAHIGSPSGGFGGTPTAAVDTGPNWGPALLLLMLYLAGGVLAALLGFQHSTSTATALHAADDALRAADADHRAAMAGLVNALEVEAAKNELDERDHEEYVAAGEQRRHWARELMNLARLVMAERADHISAIPLDGPVHQDTLAGLRTTDPTTLFTKTDPVPFAATDPEPNPAIHTD